jgi:hypothetical protein
MQNKKPLALLQLRGVAPKVRRQPVLSELPFSGCEEGSAINTYLKYNDDNAYNGYNGYNGEEKLPYLLLKATRRSVIRRNRMAAALRKSLAVTKGSPAPRRCFSTRQVPFPTQIKESQGSLIAQLSAVARSQRRRRRSNLGFT